MAVRTFFSRALYPLVLGGSVFLVAHSIESGSSPVKSLLIASLVSTIIVAISERIFSFRRSWNSSKQDIRTDALHSLFSTFGMTELTKLIIVSGMSLLPDAWKGSVAFWPNHWPLLIQLGMALVIGEFAYYWLHRLAHESSLLFRFHSVHHSAERLYWLNAGRFHPVEGATYFFIQIFPLVLLGASQSVLAMYYLFTNIHGMFKHSNIDIEGGLLNYIFSTAELHRWHHSTLLEEANGNYGGNLIVWDMVFGTRVLPRNRVAPDEVGLKEGMDRYPKRYLKQLAIPFRQQI